MEQHIGTTVFVPGVKGDMKVLSYQGKNSYGTHMFRVILPSGVTRLYRGERLMVRVGKAVSPMIAPVLTQAA
jgi:hypothetical protein